MVKPTVSVVMCTYNGAAFIEEQLTSILAQTYPLQELLIFDDGSTDETATLIRKYCDQYPVIQFHQNTTNIGFNANFEQALKAASCEVIAIADQDDYWHPEKIERMIAAWKDDTLLIYCDSFRFKGDIPTNATPNPIYRRFEGNDARKLFLYNTISGHAMLIRKQLLDISLPFREGVIYDWWMGVVAACNGGVSYLPESLVYQRVHEKNATIISDQAASKVRERALYKKQVLQHLYHFPSAANMPLQQRKFGVKFYKHWERSFKYPFYWPLFLFLIKSGPILFWYKKRKIGLFSQIKHSFLMTKNWNTI